MGSVSVPFAGIGLSPPLPVIALVGRYPTNKLIGPRPVPYRITPLPLRDYRVLDHLSMAYSRVRGRYQGIPAPFAALVPRRLARRFDNCETSARLACLIHAASVHRELGSNSLNRRKTACCFLWSFTRMQKITETAQAHQSCT